MTNRIEMSDGSALERTPNGRMRMLHAALADAGARITRLERGLDLLDRQLPVERDISTVNPELLASFRDNATTTLAFHDEVVKLLDDCSTEAQELIRMPEVTDEAAQVLASTVSSLTAREIAAQEKLVTIGTRLQIPER